VERQKQPSVAEQDQPSKEDAGFETRHQIKTSTDKIMKSI
jgi:hypothetical protein